MNLFSRKQRQEKQLDLDQVVQQLTELSPPSVLVYLEETGNGRKVDENLGKAFLLQRDQRLYTDVNHLYITTPEDLKVASEGSFRGRDELVALQFMHRRVPYRLECRVVGRFRLLPEVVELLDFKVRAAYKLLPTSRIRKEDKRGFLRYAVKNYGDSRQPVTTHVTFDVFLRLTRQEITSEGAPPAELTDLRFQPPDEPSSREPVTARAAIDRLRELLLSRPMNERRVYLTKIVKSEAKGYRRKHNDAYLLGYVDVLGLDQEIRREVIYTKRSAKADFRKDNPYNLRPGDRVLAQFRHDASFYYLPCEVLEARTGNEVLRPRGLVEPEAGLKVELVEYSVGGALLESSTELLTLLLGERCPPQVGSEDGYRGRVWEAAFDQIRHHLVHLTFYPSLHFAEKLKNFQPDLPFAIPILGQIVRHQVHGERRTLQFGLRFAYDPEEVPLTPVEPVTWRLLRGVRDNVHFTEVHSKLSQLYGHLEHQSLARTALRD
ncbi:MAG: hypothetical protein WDA75_19480 [Candidatus Latescibacterota bacterium]